MEELDNIKSNETSNENDNSYECLNFDGPLNKKCLNKEFYVNNYIYYAIKKDKLPPEEFILGYGNGKIFNDVAKYYFERGDFKKSENYLLKAYPILNGKDKEIVAFNLGVLYATINTLENNAKAVKYFKQTSFKEAYFNLGVNYYIGLGVKEDDKKAYYYFKKAAEKGLERAKFNLTQMKKLHLNLKK
jgi:TPR repeat protein